MSSATSTTTCKFSGRPDLPAPLELGAVDPTIGHVIPHGATATMKRILLFVLTNLAVMLVLGVVTSVFGLNRYMGANGLNLGALLAYAAVIGFTGAIISLLLSKPIAKWSTGAEVINESSDPTHRWIVSTVESLAQRANIGMPEVAIFEGAPNAFATGAFKNSA